MKELFKNWNIIRAIRLILGTLILVEGVQAGHWILIIFGAVFAGMSVLNIGCPLGPKCSTPVSDYEDEEREVIYEEVE